MQLIFHYFDLHLRHTFTIANDSRDIQQTLVVELRDGHLSGFGEATSNPYYGVTIEAMVQVLEKNKTAIENYDLQNPADFWIFSNQFLQNNPFAQCALDVAANDLWAKKQGQKLYEAWGLSADNNPITDFTIGIDSIEKMVSKMKELPWPLYKIKLGTDNDLAIVRELRKHTSATFRVDANCAWTADQTIANALVLRDLGVEFIEQPLPADDWTGMKKVYLASVLPIVADESCIVEADVARCAGYFHGVNVKLTKCGGLTPARRMIAEAKSLNMTTMVGCMNESSVGISAIAHLLPLLDYVDMDGSLLITNDPASGVTFDFGRVIYASENGIGVKLVP
jgi:L-alanine-DL-glutamate epimerase-like enolase superfamily enzyme